MSVEVTDQTVDIEIANGFAPVPTVESPHEKVKDRKLKNISWAHVNFFVGKKQILNECWGEVHPGEICAIMGPSGAGKSSLLNVLAGRSTSNSKIHVEGKVKVGGHVVNPVSYRKNIAYVMQDDFILATATPREALTFSASLRLPATWTEEAIKKKVDTLIADLGIEDCCDTLIGGELIKGISGGQRKRTSVGIELITDPTLLFLDEPTTGLDSYSALNLMKLLKKLSQHCAILLTIHQPSSQIFFLFDVIIYMKDGRIFYQGPVKEMCEFYTSRGYSCPDNFNPSDYIMDICQAHTSKELDEKGLFQPIPERFTNFDQAETSLRFNESDLVFHFESSFGKQLSFLAHREVVNTIRDIHTTFFKFFLTFVMMFLSGIIFYQIGAKDYDNMDDFNSHFGALMMVMMFSLMGSAQSVLLSFPFERPMVLKEYVTGTYGIPAYFIGKIFTEIPLVFAQMVFAYIVAYFLMGLQGNFIFLVLISWGLGMVSCSLAMGLGCLVPNVKDVTELTPIVFLPQILFAGFFIRTSLIPKFLRWAQYLCGIKYALNLAIMTEFQVSGEKCSKNHISKAFCENLIKVNDIHPDQFYIYIILLAALAIFFRIIGGILLHYKAKRFY